MISRTHLWAAIGLVAILTLLTVLACGETQPKEMLQEYGLPDRKPPLLPSTPTASQIRKRTPMEVSDYDGTVDGDIFVWRVPCPPIHPKEWYTAPVLLHHLDSNSYLHLDWDGSFSTEAPSDYRTDEGRERLEAVLADRELMEFILTPLECP